MEIHGLLRSQIFCLKRFYEATQEFINHPRLEDFVQLEKLTNERETILKAYSLYSKKASECVSEAISVNTDNDILKEINALLSEKDEWIQKIKLVDAEVTRILTNEKLGVQSNLFALQKAKDGIGKFRSGWITQSGEEFDQSL